MLFTGYLRNAATEMTLRDYMRACKRGMGQAQSKAYFSFDKLFHLDPLLCEPTKFNFCFQMPCYR